MNEKITKRNILLFYLIYFLTIPLGIIIRIFYSRTLTVQEMGLIYSIIGFYSFLISLSNLGLSASLRYFVPKFLVKSKKDDAKNIFWYSFLSQITISIIIATVIIFSSKIISAHFFHNTESEIYIKILSGYFIFISITNPLLDIFVSFKKSVTYQTIYFFQMFLILCGSLIFWFLKKENLIFYYSITWSLSVMIIFITYIILLKNKKSYFFTKPKFKKPLLKKFIKYSLYMFSTVISFLILGQIDIIIITYFLGSSPVAQYSNTLTLINMLISIFTVTGVLFMPFFSEQKERKNTQILQKIIKFLYEFITYLISPVVIIFSLYPKQILILLFGKEYSVTSSILILFSIFSILKVLYVFNTNFLSGLGKAKELTKIILPVAIMNLILNIILINIIQLYGVAISTIFSWGLIFLLTYKKLKKELKITISKTKVFKTIAALLIFIINVIFLKELMINRINIYLNAIISIGISYMIYLIIGKQLKIYSIEELKQIIPDKILKQITKIKNLTL